MDISILIPARNEEFLAKTIENLLENIEADTEIIAVLDGEWANPPIAQHERVTVVYLHKSIGQRAATNVAARLARGKYLIKVDAHCSFDKGFDRKMLEAYAELPDGDSVTMIPTMRNLWAFDWKCKKCGNRWYQGPDPEHCCKDKHGKERNALCDSTEFEKEIVWEGKKNPQSNSYRFDKKELHFYYFREWEERPENRKADLIESMSIQGSFFMVTKAKYMELDLSEEAFGSWGQQGVEVACKTWLSGGRVVVNKRTWYAHMFRTQTGFQFPYPLSGAQVDHARKYSRYLFEQGNWPKAIRPLSWLVEKFSPVPGWHDAPLRKGIIYYTDNLLHEEIMKPVQEQIIKCAKQAGISGKDIISASLKPIKFGKNITLPLERGYLTMAKQILAALEASTADIIFFCEHDVLYDPSHFEFTPTDRSVYYYNQNAWQVRATDGHAIYYDCKKLSQLVAFRDTLITHYKERVRRIEEEGFTRAMGFEPGTHNRKERIDDLKAEGYQSKFPNLDIRHAQNLTSSRWKKEEFRDQRNCQNWQEAEEVAPWYTQGNFNKLLDGTTTN